MIHFHREFPQAAGRRAGTSRVYRLGLVVLAIAGTVGAAMAVTKQSRVSPRLLADVVGPLPNWMELITAASGIEPSKARRRVLLEFGDDECSECALVAGMVELAVDSVRDQWAVGFLYLPRAKQNNRASLAAIATECANDQGQFRSYRMELRSRKGRSSDRVLVGVAARLGLDVLRFRTCLMKHLTASLVERQIFAGRQLGLQDGPVFYLDGIRVRAESLHILISAALDPRTQANDVTNGKPR